MPLSDFQWKFDFKDLEFFGSLRIEALKVFEFSIKNGGNLMICNNYELFENIKWNKTSITISWKSKVCWNRDILNKT